MALTLAGNGTVTGLDWGASGGGLVLVAESSFSAVSSVSVDGCFTSDYDNYRVLLDVSGSADGEVLVRLRSASSDYTTNNHVYQHVTASNTTINGARVTAATGIAVVFSRSELSTCGFEVHGPALVRPTHFHSVGFYDAEVPVLRNYSGYHPSAASYDGFTIYPASGTLTGSLSVYGYAKGA
jgi:hypothetical protein